MRCRLARQRLPCGSSSWLSWANCMRTENGPASRCARHPTPQRWLTRGDRARPLKEADLEVLPIGGVAYSYFLARGILGLNPRTVDQKLNEADDRGPDADAMGGAGQASGVRRLFADGIRRA